MADDETIKGRLLNRRRFIKASAASLATGSFAGQTISGVPLLSLTPSAFAAEVETGEPASILKKAIPSTGEMIPALGMGTWITFNVGDDVKARAQRVEVLRAFFRAGGGMIDSSPMYGSAEAVVGHCLDQLSAKDELLKPLVSATKIWTAFEGSGRTQFQDSLRLWRRPKIDVMQIHNLLNWKTHLKTLIGLKENGLVRYIGITTSHGRRHDDFAAIMRNEPIDFVQFTYNIDNRVAEDALLPLAIERKLAVIVNRPFGGGGVLNRYDGKPLPDWAGEIGCRHWSQFLLKFILSHPAVTVAIPATSRVDHMLENMEAGYGDLPSKDMRARMIAYTAGL